MSRRSPRIARILAQIRNIADDNSDADAENTDNFDDTKDDDFENAEEDVFEGDSDSSESSDNESVDSQNTIQNSINNVVSASSNIESMDDDNFILSKNRLIRWYLLQNKEYARIRNRLNFSEKAGPTSYALRNIDSTPLSAFFLILDKSIMKKISNYTNEEAERCQNDFVTTYIDILRFIGVLLCRGVFCQKMSVKKMWSNEYGLQIVKSFLHVLNFFQL